MSKEYDYNKVVQGAQLHEELKAADFRVITVYSKWNPEQPELSEPYCKVVVEDAETKDPTAIVESHTPKLEPPPRDLTAEIDAILADIKTIKARAGMK